MALRSGLLMESTWALDTLNVLLYDDNSVTYFGLGNMPGLLEALIEHWRASLIAMFDLTLELELANTKGENNRKRKREKLEKASNGVKWYEKRPAVEEEETCLGMVDSDVLRRGDKVRILHHQPKDYTQEARFSEKEFQVEDRVGQLFVDCEERDWDEVGLGFASGRDLWANGGGDTTHHILHADAMFGEDHFRLPFVRILDDGKASSDGESSKRPLSSASSALLPSSSVKEEPKEAKEPTNNAQHRSTNSASSTHSEISPPGKKHHGKRVPREEWKVSPNKSEEKSTTACNSSNSGSSTTNAPSNNTTTTTTTAAATTAKTTTTTAAATTTTSSSSSDSNSSSSASTSNSDSTLSSNTTTSCSNNFNTSTTTSSQVNQVKSETNPPPLCNSAVKQQQSDENTTDNTVKKSEAAENEKGDDADDDVVESIRRRTGIVFREPADVRRRWQRVVLEEENYQPDQASLNLVTEAEDALGRRAVVVSTILRNLSFVPGNEPLLGNAAGFLAVCGRLILHAHWHPARSGKQRNYDKGAGAEEEDFADSCTSLMEQKEWWWEHLQVLRENVMVALSNVAGHMDLSPHPEHIVLPLLSGLLEWAVSPAAAAQDAFQTVGQHSNISPQRLAIETLCKLCINEGNIDLLLSTPPYTRLEELCSFLSKKLYRSEDQVMREFAINLLFYFSGADSGVARTIALQDTTVSLLIGFIEQAEQNAMVVAQQHGVNALRDNPDSMGTSLDMLRRAANTLNNLSRHRDNAAIFVRHEQRLLNLVMSQILDQGVAGIVSQVIFQISREST